MSTKLTNAFTLLHAPIAHRPYNYVQKSFNPPTSPLVTFKYFAYLFLSAKSKDCRPYHSNLWVVSSYNYSQ